MLHFSVLVHPYLANKNSFIRQVIRLINSAVIYVLQDNAVFNPIVTVYHYEICLVGSLSHEQTKFVTQEISERTFLLD